MNILITGGAGFIGSHLAKAFLLLGNKVVIVDNFDPFYSKEIKEQNLKEILALENSHLVVGDIRDKETLKNIFSTFDIELVVHLAAKAGVRPSIENPEEYYDVNVNGTLTILQTMKDYNVKKMIFASSSSIYGNNKTAPFSESDFVDNPISPYAATKKSCELMCHVFSHLYDFDITCLRFFTVYGPGQRPDLAIHKFIKLIYKNEPIPFFGDGSSARDYTYISDIVQGIVKAANNIGGYHIYNLGNSHAIKLVDLVNVLGELTGKDVKINYLPNQEGDVVLTYADISKSISEINYSPEVSIENGLMNFLEWFKTENAIR